MSAVAHTLIERVAPAASLTRAVTTTCAASATSATSATSAASGLSTAAAANDGGSDGPCSRSRAAPGPVCADTLRAHIWLVHDVVMQLQTGRRLPANVLREDLVAAGLFGLVDSLRRNGGAEGESFERYARIKIRCAIFDELRSQDWLTRRARDAAVGSDGEKSRGTTVHLLDKAGVEEALVNVATANSLSEVIEARSEHRALARAVAELPEREQRIVSLHYFEGVKFKDIGAALGVSEPRISQLHSRALGRLREMLERAPRRLAQAS